MSQITSNYPNFPITEPTSALMNEDLLIKVSKKLGLAYYGADGTGVPSVPNDPADLALCQDIVNDAIRMFINDGPEPNGWKWLNRIAQVDLWPQIAFDPTNATNVSAVYNSTGPFAGLTTLTLTSPPPPPPPPPLGQVPYVAPTFLASMELRPIWIGGNPPANTPGLNLTDDEFPLSSQLGTQFTIVQYLGPYTVNVIATPASVVPTQTPQVPGGAFPAGTVVTTEQIPALIQQFGQLNTSSNYAIGFGMVATGDYTLPADFGGQYTGPISFIANTNRGMILRWIDEFSIRQRRQNYNIESGTPYEAAVRLIPTPTYSFIGYIPPRQRWELMTWRISSEFLSVIFPYTLHFNDLVNLYDTPPAPFGHDEAIKAACYALCEKEVDDSIDGPDWTYYKTTALPQSKLVDGRAVPKCLGYFGNPTAATSKTPAIRAFRDYWYQRPTVPVFGTS